LGHYHLYIYFKICLYLFLFPVKMFKKEYIV